MHLKDIPAIGQPLEGGLFAGLTTAADGTNCAVVLLADEPGGEMTWKDAMAWAAGIGAALPTRPLSALLFMHLKGQFKDDWYWTCEQAGASGAWCQYFDNGFQDGTHKSAELRARAVRLIQLTA